MKQIIFYFILLVNTLQIACSQNKRQINVEQISSNQSVVLIANFDEGKVVRVNFYPMFQINNNTDDDVSLSYPQYLYSSKLLYKYTRGWMGGIPIHYYSKDTLISISINDEIAILGKKIKIYSFPTSHTPSQDSLTQSLFSSYLEKMKAENKDTLHIGTISELKKRNSPILQLLEGDSIIISFDKKDYYIDPIPVQIK